MHLSDSTTLQYAPISTPFILEQKLLHIVELFSVEISYVAEMVGQESQQAVEAKLSVLDKVFYGLLDQGPRLWLFACEPEANASFSVEYFHNPAKSTL